MSSYMWTLLIMVALAIGVRTWVLLTYNVKRRAFRTRFKEYGRILVGINPKNGRKVIYETASMSKQKLAWIVAQNRSTVNDGLKEFAETQSVDNGSIYLDTFGVRHSALMHRRLIRNALSAYVCRFRTFKESARRVIKHTSIVIRTKLKALPRLIIRSIKLLRNLIKLTFGSKGEADDGASNSFQQDMHVRKHKDS